MVGVSWYEAMAYCLLAERRVGPPHRPPPVRPRPNGRRAVRGQTTGPQGRDPWATPGQGAVQQPRIGLETAHHTRGPILTGRQQPLRLGRHGRQRLGVVQHSLGRLSAPTPGLAILTRPDEREDEEVEDRPHPARRKLVRWPSLVPVLDAVPRTDPGDRSDGRGFRCAGTSSSSVTPAPCSLVPLVPCPWRRRCAPPPVAAEGGPVCEVRAYHNE